MSLSRRLLAALAVLLGGAGVLLSLGGIPRAWMYRDDLSEIVAAAIDRLEPPVARVEALLGRVEKRLSELRQTLRELKAGLDELRDRAPKLDDKALARLKVLAAQLVTTVDDVRAQVDHLHESVESLNKLLNAARVLAPGRMDDLDTQLLRQTAERLSAFSADAGELSDWLKDFLADRLKDWALGKVIPRLLVGLDDITGRVERLRDSAQRLVLALPAARDRALYRLHLAAIIATAVLVWIAVAQAVLFAQGLRWWRRST